LRHYESGKEHLPHPLLDRITPFHGAGSMAYARVKDAGSWVPASMPKLLNGKPTLAQRVTDPRAVSAITQGFLEQYPEKKDGFDRNRLVLAKVQCVIEMAGHRRFRLKPGDHVAVAWDGGDDYAEIDNIILIVYDDCKYLWFIPRWFELKKNVNGETMTHPKRTTTLVTDEVVDIDRDVFFAIPVSKLLRQVLIVHLCVWPDGVHVPRPQATDHPCVVHKQCYRHHVVDCDCLERHTLQQDYTWKHVHDTRNYLYEVFDFQHGFIPEGKADLGAAV
jgi:hypothetical protein